MTLCDDYIQLEHIPDERPKIQLLDGTVTAGATVKARVVAMGPGELRPDGQRQPMPCKSGDVVRVMKGAGFRDIHDGSEVWFVYGGRKDILGVVDS